MNDGIGFLRVIDTYDGYCHICHEAKQVGRIAVAGWPHRGAVCTTCLRDLADEVLRRAHPQAAMAAGDGNRVALVVGGNGSRR